MSYEGDKMGNCGAISGLRGKMGEWPFNLRKLKKGNLCRHAMPLLVASAPPLGRPG